MEAPASSRHGLRRRESWARVAGLARAVLFLVGSGSLEVLAAASPSRPNIIFVLADDLGYGDPQCFNARSKIPTPNIDRLAREGMRFTDAHAAGSVCVPSRYGLMTGRYPFRNVGIKQPTKGALIERQRPTLATVLRDAGYTTAMIGKWHLGFEGGDRFDFNKPLRGGPCDHGFDSFFGQHASLDIPPYFYIEDDHAVAAASDEVQAGRSEGWSPIQGAFWRAGKIAPGFKHPEVLPTYTRRAVGYLEARSNASKPFFLYLALTAPHTPWLPMEEFRNKSLGGLYGDFVAQLDDSLGQVLGVLDRKGLAENTLVFFSSDNGPVWLPEDVVKFGHSATGPWRGMKGDAWEGGHRMPFIARWPGRIAAGTTCGETICFTDLFATCASLAGAGPSREGVGEDSLDFSPALLGVKHDRPARDVTIHESSNGGMLSIRQANWKLIPQLGSGGFSKPARRTPGSGEPAGQLYDLAADPGETRNLYADRPEIVSRLSQLLAGITAGPTPASVQPPSPSE